MGLRSASSCLIQRFSCPKTSPCDRAWGKQRNVGKAWSWGLVPAPGLAREEAGLVSTGSPRLSQCPQELRRAALLRWLQGSFSNCRSPLAQLRNPLPWAKRVCRNRGSRSNATKAKCTCPLGKAQCQVAAGDCLWRVWLGAPGRRYNRFRCCPVRSLHVILLCAPSRPQKAQYCAGFHCTSVV